MMIELDLRSHVPIYVQIVERIEHLVAAGVLQPDDQLPTVRQLAADLRVNFNTIARAYRMLDAAGIISTQQGRGTFVLQPPPPEQALALREAALQRKPRCKVWLTHSSRRHPAWPWMWMMSHGRLRFVSNDGGNQALRWVTILHPIRILWLSQRKVKMKKEHFPIETREPQGARYGCANRPHRLGFMGAVGCGFCWAGGLDGS